MVFECLLAATALAEMGIAARVINMHSVKPLDTAVLAATAAEVPRMLWSRNTPASAAWVPRCWRRWTRCPMGPSAALACPTAFPRSAHPMICANALGLSACHIFAQALDLLR